MVVEQGQVVTQRETDVVEGMGSRWRIQAGEWKGDETSRHGGGVGPSARERKVASRSEHDWPASGTEECASTHTA